MWIEGGRLKEYGDVEEVCDEYAEYVDLDVYKRQLLISESSQVLLYKESTNL